jgi:AraC-like DNA-binding protein
LRASRGCGSVREMSAPLDLTPYNDFDVAVSSIHNVLDKIAAPGWEYSWTRRRHHGLIRVVSGTVSFVSSEWHYDLEPGEILRLEREDTYRVAAGSEGCRFTVVNYFVVADSSFSPVGLPRRLRTSRVSLYETLFHELLAAWNGKGVAHRIQCRSILASILYNLVYDALQEHVHGRGIGQIQPALSHIERYYNTDVRVDELARMVGVTQTHFRRLFREATGHSPKDYILYLRIMRAMDYVKSDLYSLSEIAERMGFSSVSHFSRAFKTRTGQSPMEYRQNG